MNKILFIAFALMVSLFACQSKAPKIEVAEDESIVYFCKDITPENILKLYEALDVDFEGKTAIKLHFGEEGNQNFLNPELLTKLVEKTKGTFVETNVLYVSKRRFTDSHIALAKEHGFDFAPIDILDAEGEMELPAEGLKHYDKVKTGNHLMNYDNYIVYSHFKGHGASGFGGAIKNVSMGMASPGGKMAMHASAVPATYHVEKCFQCNRCVEQCPGDAITITSEGPIIDPEKCLGCAKCIAECPQRIFSPSRTEVNDTVFMERLVEYAAVISAQRPMVYINVMDNISTLCDCNSKAPEPFVGAVGAVASKDIIAIDKACNDLVSMKHGSADAFAQVNNVSGIPQIDYGQQLGLGNKKYVLVDVATGERISLEEAIK